MLVKLTDTYGSPVHININQIVKIEGDAMSGGTTIILSVAKDDGALKQFVGEPLDTVVSRVQTAYNSAR